MGNCKEFDLNNEQLFKGVITTFKLQLNINKQLYENGNISKELYDKVENIILQRLRPISDVVEGNNGII